MTKSRLTEVLVLAQFIGLSCAVLPLMVPAAATANPTAVRIHDGREKPSLTDENKDGKNYSVSRIIVHAKQESVWRVLTDYNNATKVFPQLRRCQVLEDKGSVKVMKHEIAPSGLGGCTYSYVLEVRESAPKHLEWHRVSGDFKSVDGFWQLEPANGGHDTLVSYMSYVNGGLFIPQMLIKRQFRVDAPSIMANLKTESEGGIKIARKPDSSPTE